MNRRDTFEAQKYLNPLTKKWELLKEKPEVTLSVFGSQD